MAPEITRGGVEQSTGGKQAIDFKSLVADSHLTKEERKIITEAYKNDKEALLAATQGDIKNFILRDYGAANYESLGWTGGIKKLQTKLKVDPVDGFFGPDTFKALIEYQKSNGLETDAIAGPKTMKSLGISKVENKTSASPKKNNDNWVYTGGVAGITREVSPANISAAPRIKNFSNLVGSIEDQIKNINDMKKESTGIVGGIGDWIGEKTWAYETGKDIYERQIKQVQERSKAIHGQLIAEFNGKNISPNEQAQIDSLIARLGKTSGAKLNNVSWGTAVSNSLGDDPKIESGVGSKVFHGALGMAEGAFGLVEWVLDLTIFLGKLFSPEYRAKISDQYDQLQAYLKKHGWVTNVAIEAFKNEVTRISSLPPDEMAGAIGKITGTIIATLATGWVLGAASKAEWAASATSKALGAASKTAQLAGKSEKAASLGLAASREASKAMYIKIGIFVLNGPAESALGAGLSNSFRLASGVIRWGTSIGHKLQTVEKSIADFTEAMSKEKSLENLKHIREAKEALETARNKLASEIAAKKATKEALRQEKSSAKKKPEWETPNNTAERKKSLSELESELSQKKAELAKSEDMARTPYGWASDGLLANEARLKKEIGELEWAIKEEKTGASPKSESTVGKPDNTEPEAGTKSKESWISNNPPKAFDISWIDTPEGFKKVYRRLARYYHTDLNSNPDAEALFKELKQAFKKNDKEKFAKIAKDPESFIKNQKEAIAKTAERTARTPLETMMDRVTDYEKVFSKELLQNLARTDAHAFGMSLVEMFHIRQIKELAKTDPSAALIKWETYLKSPKKYLESAYAPPYHSIDDDIKYFANQEYKGAYKSEWEALAKQHQDAYENWLKNNIDTPKWSFEKVQQIIGDFDELTKTLWDKASIVRKNIEDIINLLKWNVKENFSGIMTRIDSLIESLRLSSDISLDLKARISRKLKEIKDSFLDKKMQESSTAKEKFPEAPKTKNPWTKESWAKQAESAKVYERRNTEFREWHEVPRAKEIISVGDLHGSRRAFELNLQKSGAINKNGDWIGGNREIVFHGDILADRNADSLAIFDRIRTLRAQAQKEGWNITILAGNHEDFAFAYLTWKDLPSKWNWVPANSYAGSQSHGISEFKQFWNTPQEILLNMRNSKEGRQILEDICAMKLAEHIDDTLFVHVVPNEAMLTNIASMWVDKINKVYQSGMRFHLLGEWVEPLWFNSLRLSFLDTESRVLNARKPVYDSLREKGINHIIHGHDVDNAGASIDMHGMKITGNDFWFEKQAGAQAENPSFIKVEKNGNFEYGNGSSMSREAQRKAA